MINMINMNRLKRASATATIAWTLGSIVTGGIAASIFAAGTANAQGSAAAPAAPAAGSAEAPAAGPSDAEIAHIVVTANTIDIDAGKLAQSKAKSKDVKAFAKKMVTDHTGVNKKATELAKKEGVTPKDNDVSKSLLSGASENMKKLKGLKGADFDKAYVENEVTYHQAVLDALDKTLIPNAKNEKLKELMVSVRPAFVDHLEHATKMKETLSK